MKRVVVIVRCDRPERAREALRAAVGLSLRGAHISVRGAVDERDPESARALAMLVQLGHDVALGGDVTIARDADAVEVWT